MCGIAGIFDLQGKRKIREAAMIAMGDSIRHRGPDEDGIAILPGVGLAHRRLAIIDLSSGQQPMVSDDGQITLIFNGEIFNYQDVRKELINRGHQFKTHSDTETIIYAWKEWHQDCVNHLWGFFAFALYDQQQDCLFCARDRLGLKPFLYTTSSTGLFCFASEHKAIKMLTDIDLSISNQAIEDYFALGYIPDPGTIYENIKRLPPGHHITLRRNRKPEIHQYWDLPFEQIELTPSEAPEMLYQKLREAVDIRLMSEVPLGAFLSGGVDSSSVVAIMSELQSKPVKTCTIGFNEPDYNEAEFAREVADHCKTDHFEQTVDSNDIQLVDKLAAVYDEPFADPSALPTYQVCQLARQQVTVALSGDGADELMSGYRHHRMHLNEERLRAMIPSTIRKPVFSTLGQFYPKADWAPRFLRAKSTLLGLGMDSVEAYFSTVAQTTHETRQWLFHGDLKHSLNGYQALEHFKYHAARAPRQDPQSLIQYLDAKTYLPGDILTKVDRASMANSLEVRAPFLDHQWVEWITSIGNEYKYDGHRGKALLKTTMEPKLPAGILHRKKMGFSVPLARWYRGPLKAHLEEMVHGRTLGEAGYFDTAFLGQLEKEHLSGLRDHSTLIWSLMMFEGFLNGHSTSTKPVSPLAE